MIDDVEKWNDVMPRKRHVSRNVKAQQDEAAAMVMPRKRHVSRNFGMMLTDICHPVMPRKRHVSRNVYVLAEFVALRSCLARGM